MRPIPDMAVKAGRFAVGTGALIAIFLTVRRWIFDIVALDAVYYKVYPTRAPSWEVPFVAAALIAALAAWKRLSSPEHFRSLATAWLLFVLLALPQTFLNLAAVLAVIAWCLLRRPKRKIPRRPLSETPACVFAALLATATAIWSFYLQRHAFRALFLAYQDWGEYAECYLHLADGGLPLRAWLVQAGHFNPLPNILMTLLLKVRRAPEVVFFVSAMLSGWLTCLTYLLAREYRLPRGSALTLTFAAALNPVFANQSLSLFYGFHPILFQGPLILAFFIFEHRKNRLGMAATIILSLLVQETAAALWAGYALYLFSRKRFIPGIALGGACVAFFVLVSKVVIPFASGTAVHPQIFHYAQLGDSLSAILLSPLLRPRAFWATLFQYQNLCFVSALLLPLGVLALRAPRRLLIGVPLLAGVLLQGSPDVKNPVMQYGFEITVVILAGAVYAAGKMLELHSPEAKRALRAGLRTAAVMTVLCAFYWMQEGWFSPRGALFRPNMMENVTALRSCSEPGSRVLSTKRLRLYHMFDRQVAPLEAEWRPGDTIVLDFADAMEPVSDIRRRLLEDPRAVPCWPPDLRPSDFVVWKIADKPRPPWSFLRHIEEAEFRCIGLELQQNDPAFEARVTRFSGGQPAVLLRLKSKIDCDVWIHLKLLQDGKEAYHTVCFGTIYPMWYATPGDTFIIPISGPMPTTLQMAVTRRK